MMISGPGPKLKGVKPPLITPQKKRKTMKINEESKPSSPESFPITPMGQFISHDYESELNFEDIVKSLNGFARIIRYRAQVSSSDSDSPKYIKKKNLEILRIEEGFFRNGQKSGYCRVFNGETAEVECGFFRKDVPTGKYVRWDMEENEVEEGIYKNNKLASNVIITDFVFNVETYC